METICLVGSNKCVDKAVTLYLVPCTLCASLVPLMTFYPYCRHVYCRHVIIALSPAGTTFTQRPHARQRLVGHLAPSRCAVNVCTKEQLYQVFLCFHKTLMHHGFSQFYGHSTMRHRFLLIFESCERGNTACLYV